MEGSGQANVVAMPGQEERSLRDRELAERAKLGDTEAFGELIHSHRARARRWAENLTRDPHLADDVVQEALVKAFLHVGSLANTSRFLPWLHRIVQNQANMKLRRGGPFRRERPIGGWGERDFEGSGNVDWENLDSILTHLTKAAAMSAAHETDPAELLIRKELYETIHALLHCLNRKERGIFEAHFFRQLTPDEIAALYHTTTGSVYTYLHRSRRKLRKAHVRVLLGLPSEKGGAGMNQARMVTMPEWPPAKAALTTFVDRIGHMLAAIGDERPMSELMGLSGFAFRLKISNRTTFADGIFIFDWRETLRTFMEELGYEVTMICGQLSEAPVPLLAAAERFPVVLPIEEAVLPFIRRYVELGKPVLYFDTLATQPHVHEWALIYGYDDVKREVYVTDLMRPEGKTLSYDDLVENPLRFMAGIDGGKDNGLAYKKPREVETALRQLRFAVKYARTGCDYKPMTVYLSYTSGLAAYDRWIGFMNNPSVLPNRYGMGHLAAVYAEARRYAAEYLRTVPLKGEPMRLVLLAAEAYLQAAEALQTLSQKVPFIRSSTALPPETLAECALLLEKAKEFETAGVGYLENALNLWDQEEK
ncbi:RNA polymerase sigma factor [Paenibacillus sp. sptzw28]|uniref:RNA polymerase sigma factor n=1 Tax=Paenibacillus sp. sptzw28 TaxID=715179 RepID=UPI001C6E8A40|nr:RNA polymerase sigma factor [Paenibacillus sp. sptzw28]QYR21445.1 RNA polymerase sigma factor [Paenibacillus sp. sptzw28]